MTLHNFRSLWLMIVVFLIWAPGLLQAENPPEKKEVETITEEKAEHSSYEELNQLIRGNLESERRNVDHLKQKLDEIKTRRNSLKTELNAYRIQLSTYGNLLVMPAIAIQDLEKALASIQASIQRIDALLKELAPKLDHYTLLFQQTLEQQTLNEKQLTQIKNEKVEDERNGDLVKKMGEFNELLSTKETFLTELIQEYTEEIQSFSDVRKALEALVVEFESEISTRKKEALFKRKQMPLISDQWLEISKELTNLENRLLEMRTRHFWLTELNPVFKGGFYIRLFAFLIFFVIIVSVLLRLRRYCRDLRLQSEGKAFFWQSLTLGMVQRSLLLFGMTLFFMTYLQLRHLESLSLFQTALNILWIWVFTKWVFDFPILFNQTMERRIPAVLSFRVYALSLLVRIFAIPYLIIGWFMSETGMVLLAIRLLFEIVLIIWTISFVHHLKRELEQSSLRTERYFSAISSIVFSAIFLIVGGAPLLELAGYGTLASYWFLSWGRTVVVLIWATLFYFVLKEWHHKPLEQAAEAPFVHRTRTRTFQWLILKFCWLVWLIALCLGILFAWGARQTVIMNMIEIFRYPIPLGTLTLSLAGCLNAFLVLFFTQIAARLWRHALYKKILPQSGIEFGLQESIMTISTYILWSMGILMALYAFGLNMTSITVAFGALGIGLGFGLQNIFNNFISGVILLFERPIQVGDDVEVNGIWATVKKINVRSTIVQTYDNAALIIPNSDFISSQVTNWSFKDKSIRRQITVGVAYGSDIERVRDSLIEVADQTPNVFKYPKPDVLFVDFADSSLLFKLRLWTDVDHMLKVDTAVRFGIDRLFRERNITIAFPQCDVHLFQESPPSSPIQSSLSQEPLPEDDKDKK
jgi:small-conductance mechanosensitive channel